LFARILLTCLSCIATLLSSKALAKTDSGEITNLMSADSTQIVNLGRWLALGFIAPLDILGVFIFLGVVIGPSTLVVLGVLFISLPINGVVANAYFGARKKAAPLTDNRLKSSGEFIKHIRAIK
jgi:predicted Co/Zn/Cd cation transporter (cation efflux family)